MTNWKWIRHEGVRLHDIGVKPDGSLHNPNGYAPDTVRAAIAGAEQRRAVRRSAAARKAAETRRRRMERRYYDTAKRLIAGEVFGQASHCRLCGRGFSDPDSVERGIGPECWVPLTSLCNAIRTKGDEDGFDWLEVVRGLLRPAGANDAARSAQPQAAPSGRGPALTAPPGPGEQLALDDVSAEPGAPEPEHLGLMQHPYVRWFMGEHEGTAPAGPMISDPECYVLNGWDVSVDELARMREHIHELMDIKVITRNDQFAVLLQLTDAIGEAIDDLLEIGWPAERDDGVVIWQSDNSRPVAGAEAEAEAALLEEWRREALAS